MPMHPFRITEQQINGLQPVELARLLNRLLRLEGKLLGVDPSDIETTESQITTRDEGIDARVRNAPSGSRWIPAGLSVWQSKSGKKHGRAELEREYRKPGVQAALRDGGSYRIWIGSDPDVNAQKNRNDALDECCRGSGITEDRCRILFAGQIAEWANEYLPVALDFIHPEFGDLQPWHQWAATERYRNKFVADDQRQSTIQEYQRRLAANDSQFCFLRVEGQPGVGKSRLALEIFRDSPLAGLVLYAQQPEEIPGELWPYLRSNSSRLVLVVDECSYQQHGDLRERARQCRGRVKLLTIGQPYPGEASSDSEAAILLLDQLPPDAMTGLLNESFALPSDEAVRFYRQRSIRLRKDCRYACLCLRRSGRNTCHSRSHPAQRGERDPGGDAA